MTISEICPPNTPEGAFRNVLEYVRSLEYKEDPNHNKIIFLLSIIIMESTEVGEIPELDNLDWLNEKYRRSTYSRVIGRLENIKE